MPAFLLDSNHVGMAVDRTSIVGQRIFQARMRGIRLGTCLPVLCEIEAGMRQVRDKSRYRRDLNHLLRQLRLWRLTLRPLESMAICMLSFVAGVGCYHRSTSWWPPWRGSLGLPF